MINLRCVGYQATAWATLAERSLINRQWATDIIILWIFTKRGHAMMLSVDNFSVISCYSTWSLHNKRVINLYTNLSTCIQIYQLVYKFINLYTNLSTCIQGDKYIYKFISRKYNFITLWFGFINWSVPISDKISHNTIDHDTVDYNFLVLNQDTAKSNPSYMTEIL